MAALQCPCGQGSKIWGELWWTGGKHRWVFFDDEKSSRTYAEHVTRCPGCDRPLARENITAVGRLQGTLSK